MRSGPQTTSQPQRQDQFADAVRPALEALLSDLQHTTEVLRRGGKKGASTTTTTTTTEQHDPLSQRVKTTTVRTTQSGFDNLDSLLDDYADRRKSYGQDQATATRSTGNQQLQSHDSSQQQQRQQRQLQNQSVLSDMRAQRDSSAVDSVIGAADRHGIHTIPKGDCAHCAKPIIGQVVIALGRMWHPEHFNCCECGDELGHRAFFERANRAYCEADYHNLFSPRCNHCNEPIKDRCVTALGKTFHTDHFVCSECGREFGDDGFHEKNGRAYCRADFFRLFAPKCKGCQQPIQANFISALGTHWHPDCFVCQGNGYFEAQCPCNVTYFEEEGEEEAAAAVH